MSFFKKLFGKDDEVAKNQDLAPEIMGLRLGGAFELDDLRLRLIEPNLIVEDVARTQFIQAVGVVKLDESTTVLRYYTDDDGFLQLLLAGGMTENHIDDVKLWYFYETASIDSDSEWELVLASKVSQPHLKLHDQDFERAWNSVDDVSPPVAMTETTYTEDGKTSSTDQFAMLYERQAEGDLYEYAFVTGEEKIIDNKADRCLVKSTGFDIKQADISIVG